MKHLLERLWLPMFDSDDGGGTGGEGGKTQPEDGQEPAGKIDKEGADGKVPPWKDGEFDAERAWKKIQALEGDKGNLKTRAEEAETQLKAREDAEKTEQQKLEERAATAEREATELREDAIRRRVAMKYGLEEDDLDLLGSGDEEQIEGRAKRLAERDKGQEPESSRRPKERLRPGAAPSTDVEPSDPRELASRVSRGA